MEITYIFEMPSQTVQFSGSVKLKYITGADIYYLDETASQFNYKVARESEVFEFGNVRLKIVRNPMHNPFGNSILITDASQPNGTWLIPARECLFAGDIGYPGMLGKKLANELSNYLDFQETANIPPPPKEDVSNRYIFHEDKATILPLSA